MRTARWCLSAAAVFLTLQLTAVACGGSPAESPGPQPFDGSASRYAILGTDTDTDTNNISVQTVSRADFHPGSSFYSEPGAEWTLTGEYRLRDEAAVRTTLGGWGFDSYFLETLGWSDRFARVTASLFDSEAGAREAFAALAAYHHPASILPPALEFPGDESIAYDRFSEKPGQGAFGVLFRRGNLVARVELLGAPAVATPEATLALAFIVDAKAAGTRPAVAPTPGRPPTPVAPPRWADRSGRLPPADELSERQGPEHCDWGAVVFLRYRNGSYVADRFGILADPALAPFDPDARLPRDAKFTGYRSGKRELWTAASDPEAVFISAGGKVERWPRTDALCF
ncbi:MAG: hypothetical protein HY875_15565 [Chloroflexi bacterium]|nr:hypothetical protein [Chloroflexota bacterium]